jgi:SAM-dependent methyltransferase
MELESDFFVTVLMSLARTAQYSRVLIAAGADTGMQELLLHAYSLENADLQLTLVDQCETPLRLNSWYAECLDRSLETVQTSVFDFDRPGEYDLICTHSLFSFIDPTLHQHLLSAWFSLLRPGGRLLTSQSFRPQRPQARMRYTESQVSAFADRAEAAAAREGLTSPVSPLEIRLMAERFARYKNTYVLHSPEQLRKCFEQAGFQLAHFASAGDKVRGIHERAYPGAKDNWGRYQIEAVKT